MYVDLAWRQILIATSHPCRSPIGVFWSKNGDAALNRVPGRKPSLRLRYAVEHAQTRHVIPAGVGVLRR
jgi:hypothetical protein